MVLRFDGHEVRTASDGPSGLELILAAQPNVAFIDIGLPGLTEPETVELLAEIIRIIHRGQQRVGFLRCVCCDGLEQPRRPPVRAS